VIVVDIGGAVVVMMMMMMMMIGMVMICKGRRAVRTLGRG
jgi:hypothetical protein